MCGICGAVQAEGITQAHLQAMNDTLVHRGPDGAGYYLHGQVGLAMRRLAIIDVKGSDQPLYNEDRSVALVFNGEIFNYRTLRADLSAQGHRFHTDGDGETIAHLYETHGRDFPQHLRGQFAVALWDEDEQTLILARDRFGQKPLYYYHDGETLIFGSEIKALLAHPAVPCQSAFDDDPALLALYLSYGYVPAPLTAFAGIRMLEPAHTLRYHQGKVDTHAYWSVPTINPQQTQNADIRAYVEGVREALREATAIRMIADVPLGAFLSGGLDSSLIVALMQATSNQQVKTFSIGFSGDESFDETAHAREVADYLGTDHTAFTVEPQAMDLLQKLVWHHDQPFADSSAIPTYLVSEMTRQHVTVALTGDGGDELFAGYERFYAVTLLQKLAIIPKPLWGSLARFLGALPEGTDYYNPIKRARRFVAGASQPLAHAYLDWVRVADSEQVQALTQLTDDPALAHFEQYLPAPTLDGILSANQRSYLPDDLLIKADRCSMATSLEARAPFLDHVLAEQVASIPLNLKMRGAITKYVLKESARGLLPDHIIDRKKHGFGVPLGAWLRADMTPVRDMLLSSRARQRGLLDSAQVTRLIDEHANHQRDHNRILWALLTLENWHQTFIG
ncbi:MAG: asparagine synthase (glutamine-hydrolyzing) [Anaerolineae bacterium]